MTKRLITKDCILLINEQTNFEVKLTRNSEGDFTYTYGLFCSVCNEPLCIFTPTEHPKNVLWELNSEINLLLDGLVDFINDTSKTTLNLVVLLEKIKEKA